MKLSLSQLGNKLLKLLNLAKEKRDALNETVAAVARVMRKLDGPLWYRKSLLYREPLGVQLGHKFNDEDDAKGFWLDMNDAHLRKITREWLCSVEKHIKAQAQRVSEQELEG